MTAERLTTRGGSPLLFDPSISLIRPTDCWVLPILAHRKLFSHISPCQSADCQECQNDIEFLSPPSYYRLLANLSQTSERSMSQNFGMFLGGEWKTSPDSITVKYPWDNSVVGQVAKATAAYFSRAIELGRRTAQRRRSQC